MRTADTVNRKVRDRAALGEEYQTIAKSVGELERAEQLGADPTGKRATQLEQLRGRMREMEAAAAPAKKEIAAAPGLRPAAQYVREAREGVREVLPVDERFEQSLTGQIISGLGQAAGTLPLYAIPGAGPGVTIGQMYQQGYDDAKAHGADDATASNAGLANVPAAALDVAADRLVIGKILKPLKGKMTVGDVAKAVAASALGQGASEGAQQVWQNAIAKKLEGYDPERPLDDQVINSVIVGAIVGGVASGVGMASTAATRSEGRDGSPSRPSPESPIAPEADEQAKVFGDLPSEETDAAETPAPAKEAAGAGEQVAADNFAELTTAHIDEPATPESQTAAPEEAAVPGEDPADSVSAEVSPSTPPETLASAVAERSGAETEVDKPTDVNAPDYEAKLAAWKATQKPEPKGRSLRIAARPDGVVDVLDALQELGGMPAPPKGATGGEWNGFKDAFGAGLARLLVRRKGYDATAAMADVLAQLDEHGLHYESADDLYRAVKQATVDRKKATDAMRGEQDQAKFSAAMFQNDRGRGVAGGKPMNSDQFVVGQRFAVRGEPFEVTAVDADSGAVTVRDGPRFGTQVLPASTTVYPDKGSIRSAPKAKVGEDAPFARRSSSEDPAQQDMFGGGETGGDTTFNLAGETGTDFAGHMDERAAAADAKRRQERDQGTLFAQRMPQAKVEGRAQLAQVQAQWRANAQRIAPGLMQKFRLQFGHPEQLVAMGRAERRSLTGFEEAAYLAHEKILFLFDQALQKRTELGTLINLVHEMGHAHWDTLSAARQSELIEQWRRETAQRVGPLYARGGRLKRGVAHGVEASVKEWYAERLAWSNSAWARRRIDVGAPVADGLIGRMAQQFRQLLLKLRDYVGKLRGDTIDTDFRAFLDQTERFSDQPSAIGAQLEPAYARRTPAQVGEDFARNAKAWLVRNFTSAGGLPKPVLEAKLAKDARMAAVAKQIEFALRDLDRAVHVVHGGFAAMTTAELRRMNDVLGGRVPASALDPRLQAPIATMRNQIDILSRRLIREGAIDGAVVAKVAGNVGFYLNRSYRKFDDPKWAKKVPDAVLNRARTFIAAQLQAQNPLFPVNPAEVEGYVQYLLTKDVDGPEAFFRAPREGAKDLRVLTPRKEIPPELRDLLGEYHDPRVNYVRSVAKTAQILEAHKFLVDVRRMGLGRWLFDRPIKDATGDYITPIAPKGSESMGALAGLYTTPEIAQAFQGQFASADDALRWWIRVNAWAKISKTVLSPVTQVRNVLANFGFLVANGHWRADAAADVMTAMRADFGKGDTPASRNYLSRLARMGVVGESVSAGELREALGDAGARMQGFQELTDTWAARAAKLPFAAANRMYRLGDEVFKIYAFENERRAWAKADPALTAEQLDTIAAARVRNTLPTYSLIPKATRAVRRYALTGSFLSFPSEIVRTTWHTIRYATTDMQNPNPRVKAMGAKRLAGIVAVAALPAAATAISRWLTNVDADDERDVRRFLPSWNRNAALYHKGNDGRGRYRLVDVSYLDPWNYLKKPVTALLQGKDWETALRDSAIETLSPFADEGVVTKVLLDVARNVDSNGRPIANPQAPFLDRTKAQLAHVWEAFEPGAVTQAKRIVKAARGESSDTGRMYVLEDEVAAVLTGARSQSIDVGDALLFRAKRFANETTQAELIYRQVRDRNAPEGDQAAARVKMENVRRTLYAKLADDVQAAQRIGLSQGEAFMALRAGGIGEQDAALVLTGGYVPYQGNPFNRGKALQTVLQGR